MPIRVKCGNCKKTLSVKDHLAGKKIKCPVCQTVVAVPTAPPTKAPAPTATPAAKPASPAAVKKPGAKPGVITNPPPESPKSNGTPAADKTQTNGTPPVQPDPEMIELPPESIEAEAASAFADEPKPVEEDIEPKFIDFKCDWCDEMVKLPIELGGKQSQCPNPECKRIIKVPMPKVVEKKDWRKMDRRGPAAALVNQPAQLDDAWGTQDATKAKQSSLKEAGAIEEKPKPPVGAAGWIIRGFYSICTVALLVVVVIVGKGMFETKEHHDALKEVKKLVDTKIKAPLMSAEGHRALALLYLRDGKAYKAKDHFQGSLSLVDDKNPTINDQLFLIELALSQIELGGEGDDLLTKKKLEWEEVRKVLAPTLQKIQAPEVRVLALREVSVRLIERKQVELSVGLAAGLSTADDAKKPRPQAFRQMIALLVEIDQETKLDKVKPPTGGPKEKVDANARVGFAEGLARKGDFEGAFRLAQLPGPANDKMDACLGMAASALQRKNKDEASRFVKEATAFAKDKTVKEWQLLHLVKVGVRADGADSVADIVKNLSTAFRLRAHLEIFLAVCEKSAGEISGDALLELETADKEGTTLAIAWIALAKQNARNGISRSRTRQIFEDRAATGLAGNLVEQIRPMVDIGWYLGTLK